MKPGGTLLHYRIVDKIGEGGMGEVYRAVDSKLEREVALKVLPESMATDPDRFERFQREARALAALDHPNIVTVHSVEEDGDVHFLTMGLVEGESLDRLVPRGGLKTEELLRLAIPLTDALAAAHERGITHRDLKPANVLVTEQGRVKVLDFGLAKMALSDSGKELTQMPTGAMTRTGMVMGTVPYMSPEQIQGRTADARSDVFSLGILLYEMAAGERPFVGENDISVMTSILRDPPRSLDERQTNVPARLREILARCLQKDPDKRYRDALELRDELAALQADLDSGIASVAPASDLDRGSRVRMGRGVRVLLGALLLALVAASVFWIQRSGDRVRWAREEALPELERLVDEIQFLQEGPESWRAWELAREIEAAIPDDPRLGELWPRFTRALRVASEPEGAMVLTKYYGLPEGDWVELGRTPLEAARYPGGFTRLALELPGHRTAHDLVWNVGLLSDELSYELFPDGELPDDMVWVPAGTSALYIPGLDHLAAEPTAAFLVDRHEVTNAEYKEFVDAGGYGNDEYWTQPFVEAGRTIPRDEALGRFIDRTGRPGPGTWEVGDYPAGTAELPVSGVSWYEAAAYAAWAQKSLPTIFHWNHVAFTMASSQIVPLSNLSGEGKVPVGSTASANRFGAHDLAGNVREWTWNENGRPDQRFILGGGWDDPGYAFVDAYGQSAWDRSPTNGFRCIRDLGHEEDPSRLMRPIELPFRDFMSEAPVSDETFEVFLRQFAYDRTPLEATIEEEIEHPDYLRQKITFESAYGGERMMAYLYLPRTGAPPYQTVVLFPGSGAIHNRSSESIELGRADFVVKSGRAVLYPVYKGTYERGGELESDYPSETALYKDHVIMWGKDLARSIDYLETREDIDASRLAYYGLSWGGAMGAIMPAVEPRLKANVLYVAGLNFQRALPEADQINYVTRVTQPTLMLNGELDFFFPEETSQQPMFELLGTPDEHKKRLVYPGGHSVPRTEMIRETLDWLDRYLGPVAPTGAGR